MPDKIDDNQDSPVIAHKPVMFAEAGTYRVDESPTNQSTS